MTKRPDRNQDGFMIVGLIVAIFIILLVVAIAAPTVAKSLRRDKEVEAIHRGNQYVRAVQLYYRKTGHYPGSIDQLEKTNNIRFLRQRYVDPMTGKPDWRLIHLGEAKTTVKGFFGKPLSGLNTSGGIAGSSTPGQSVGSSGTAAGASSVAPTSSFGSSSFGNSGGANSASPTGGSGFGSGSSFGSSTSPAPGTSGTTTDPSNPAGATGTATVGGGTPGSSGIGSQSASTFSGGGAPIVGVGSMAAGGSITVLNEQKTYATWEFLYDPRIEQMKANTSLLGGSSTGTPASSFGSGSGFGTPGTGVNGTAAPSNTFGSPGTTTPTAPTAQPSTPPQ